MNWFFIPTILVIFSFSVSAADRLCDKLDFIDCPDAFSGNRSSGASVPGQGSILSTAPASIANINKTGIEAIKYEGSYDINIVSGTGVVGSGFSTSNNEGTFFGNIPIETDNEFWTRKINTDKYKSHKLNGIVALNLFGKSKGQKFFSASIGLVGKYNSDTSNANGGLGLTLKAGPISASYTRSRDDDINGDNELIEYYTDSYSAGFKIANVAVDYTYLRNSTSLKTYARIFSVSAFLKKMMLTYGQRTEEHGHPVVISSDPLLIDTDDIQDRYGFLGFQYMFKKRFIFGIYHNYYLNNDFSLGLSAFF